MKIQLFIRDTLFRMLWQSSRTNSSSYTSGIEHAETMPKKKNKNFTPSSYKVQEYYSFNKWSFYDLGKKLEAFRLSQPNPNQPDLPRKTIKM
ncbi:hypothetical protein T06_14849 [Trichinella sp. T6]|nr:hypothetical protein T06_14849 [Trichinella sp. T6]